MGQRTGVRPDWARLATALLVTCFLVLQAPLAAVAGTTGVLSGTISDAKTKAPVAGARVVASSPSGTYRATSDQHGFYSIAGVTPDTYTVSFERVGYDPTSVAGVSVFADQVAIVDQALQSALKQIAKVTARSTGGAFQPNQTTTTYTITQRQIMDVRGTALNNSGRQLIDALPGVISSSNSGGVPVIRGGRANAVNFDFEGIPLQDAFSNQYAFALNLPGFAISSVQLTPGVADASFGNAGTGTVNMLARRGTYPSYSDVTVGFGAGHYQHGIALDLGTASPDGRWSEYFAMNGNDGYPLYGQGLYPANMIGRDGAPGRSTDRHIVNNAFYKWGKDNKYSLQFFLDNDVTTNYYSYGNIGQYCFATCDTPSLDDISSGTGLSDDQLAAMTPLYYGQTKANQYLKSTGRAPLTLVAPHHAEKLEFDDALNPSTFLQVRAYQAGSMNIFDYAQYSDYIPIGGELTGLNTDLTKQLNARNLLKVGASFNQLRPQHNEYDVNPYDHLCVFSLYCNDELFGGSSAGELYDFISPTDPNCPLGTDPSGKSYCGNLFKFVSANGQLQPPVYGTDVKLRHNQIGYYVSDRFTPNERLIADIGFRIDSEHLNFPAAVVDPATCTTMYLPATWNVPLDANGNPNIIPGKQCPTATFDINRQMTDPHVFEPRLSLSYKMGENDSLRASYGRSVRFIRNNASDNGALPDNFAKGYANIPAFWNPGAYCYDQGISPCPYPAGVDFGPTGNSVGTSPGFNGPPNVCGITGYNAPCTSYQQQLYWAMSNYMIGTPYQPIRPETFGNYELSYSHQFNKGRLRGIGFEVTAWSRRGTHAETNTTEPRLDSNGNPLRNPDGSIIFRPQTRSDRGVDIANGEELRLTYDRPYGLSVGLSGTWQHVLSNVPSAPGYGLYDGTIPPASLQLGLLYPLSYLPNFASSLNLSYHTRNGWRIATQWYYNHGYPTGPGKNGTIYINGVPYVVPNTNYTSGIVDTPSGTGQYIDPVNPGTVLNPTIVATRGTKDGHFPGGVYSHPDMFANASIEKTLSKKLTVGLTLTNLFGDYYRGATLNGRYQPVADGVSGPLTGTTRNAYKFPGKGYYNYPSAFFGNQPYVDLPSNEGRTFLFYLTINNI